MKIIIVAFWPLVPKASVGLEGSLERNRVVFMIKFGIFIDFNYFSEGKFEKFEYIFSSFDSVVVRRVYLSKFKRLFIEDLWYFNS